MPRVQGMDADQRRRAHRHNRGIFSLSTPFRSSSAAGAVRRRRRNGSENDRGHASAASNNNNDDFDDFDDMEFRICRPEEEEERPGDDSPERVSSELAAASSASNPERRRADGDEDNGKSAARNDNGSNPEGESSAQGKNRSRVSPSPSPSSATKLDDPPFSGSEHRRKAPPEQMSKTQIQVASPSAMRIASESRSLRESGLKAPPSRPQFNPARADSAESRFKKFPATLDHAEMPSRRIDVASETSDYETRALPPASLASEEDECSEATQRHSNKSTNQKFETVASHGCADKKTGDEASGAGGDVETERVKTECTELSAEERRSAADERMDAEVREFLAEIELAKAESRKQLQRQLERRAAMTRPTARPEVIDLLESDDDDEEDRVKEAVRASLVEAGEAERRRRDHARFHEDAALPQMPVYRRLGRREFEHAVDEVVRLQGGYERIEYGQLVRHGNANDMKKSCIAEGGGHNQTGAQYGRYSIRRMWRLFDVLEGRSDVDMEESNVAVGGDCKPSAGRERENKLKREREESSCLNGLPRAKIKAFVDIGHGIGIQVLQAGWAVGVPARGVEIMKDRHTVAQAIKGSVLENLRTDPPDATKVELKLRDFSCAIVPDKKSHKRDEGLRRFLLFQDHPEEIQQGLVIFINNAEDVFAARSNQRTGGACLDTYLANLFANMQDGARMVTLTDISCHLSQSSGWFRLDVFQSGSNAVSWGNRSVPVYVLTKLRNVWFCQNPKCEFLHVGDGGGAPNRVVDDNGHLVERCLFCDAPAKRATRTRKTSAKRRKGE